MFSFFTIRNNSPLENLVAMARNNRSQRVAARAKKRTLEDEPARDKKRTLEDEPVRDKKPTLEDEFKAISKTATTAISSTPSAGPRLGSRTKTPNRNDAYEYVSLTGAKRKGNPPQQQQRRRGKRQKTPSSDRRNKALSMKSPEEEIDCMSPKEHNTVSKVSNYIKDIHVVATKENISTQEDQHPAVPISREEDDANTEPQQVLTLSSEEEDVGATESPPALSGENPVNITTRQIEPLVLNEDDNNNDDTLEGIDLSPVKEGTDEDKGTTRRLLFDGQISGAKNKDAAENVPKVVVNNNDNNLSGKSNVAVTLPYTIRCGGDNFLQCDEETDSSIDDILQNTDLIPNYGFSLVMEDESDDESDDEEFRIGIVGYSRILEIVSRKKDGGSISFQDESESSYFKKFCKRQRRNRDNGTLKRKQIDSINALNLNCWSKPDSDWDTKYNEMAKFYEEHGRCDSPSLTEWAQEQRMQFSVNPRTISSDRIEALHRIPKWFWESGATNAKNHLSKQTSKMESSHRICSSDESVHRRNDSEEERIAKENDSFSSRSHSCDHLITKDSIDGNSTSTAVSSTMDLASDRGMELRTSSLARRPTSPARRPVSFKAATPPALSTRICPSMQTDPANGGILSGIGSTMSGSGSSSAATNQPKAVAEQPVVADQVGTKKIRIVNVPKDASFDMVDFMETTRCFKSIHHEDLLSDGGEEGDNKLLINVALPIESAIGIFGCDQRLIKNTDQEALFCPYYALSIARNLLSESNPCQRRMLSLPPETYEKYNKNPTECIKWLKECLSSNYQCMFDYTCINLIIYSGKHYSSVFIMNPMKAIDKTVTADWYNCNDDDPIPCILLCSSVKDPKGSHTMEKVMHFVTRFLNAIKRDVSCHDSHLASNRSIFKRTIIPMIRLPFTFGSGECWTSGYESIFFLCNFNKFLLSSDDANILKSDRDTDGIVAKVFGSCPFDIFNIRADLYRYVRAVQLHNGGTTENLRNEILVHQPEFYEDSDLYDHSDRTLLDSLDAPHFRPKNRATKLRKEREKLVAKQVKQAEKERKKKSKGQEKAAEVSASKRKKKETKRKKKVTKSLNRLATEKRKKDVAEKLHQWAGKIMHDPQLKNSDGETMQEAQLNSLKEMHGRLKGEPAITYNHMKDRAMRRVMDQTFTSLIDLQHMTRFDKEDKNKNENNKRMNFVVYGYDPLEHNPAEGFRSEGFFFKLGFEDDIKIIEEQIANNTSALVTQDQLELDRQILGDKVVARDYIKFKKKDANAEHDEGNQNVLNSKPFATETPRKDNCYSGDSSDDEVTP